MALPSSQKQKQKLKKKFNCSHNTLSGQVSELIGVPNHCSKTGLIHASEIVKIVLQKAIISRSTFIITISCFLNCPLHKKIYLKMLLNHRYFYESLIFPLSMNLQFSSCTPTKLNLFHLLISSFLQGYLLDIVKNDIFYL